MAKKKQQKYNLPTISRYFLSFCMGVFALACVVVVLELVEDFRESKSSSAFTTKITNKYLTLPKGTKLVYEAQTEDGLERTEIAVTGETKEVNGVKTLVYHDRVWINDELHEDTKDYITQNKETGDVWYFGEDVDNYQGGKLVDHKGSWKAGVNGAQAGIWVKANPKVGETYKQESYKGEAEDIVDVLSVTEKVSTKLGTYENCLKTYDYSPLDPEAKEYKYYCPSVGSLVLAQDLESKERTELVKVEKGSVDEEEDDDEDGEE